MNEQAIKAIANKQRQILDAYAKIAELEAEIEALHNPPVGKGDKVRVNVPALPDDRDAFRDTTGLAEVVWTVGYVSPLWPTKVPLSADGARMAMNIPTSWLVKI